MTGTARLIRSQGILILLLWAVALSSLLIGYHEVHRYPAVVADSTAPAVLQVAAARNALESAQNAATTSLRSDSAPVVGAGEEYRTQVSAARQSLSQIADRQVAGDDGRRTLETVNGLLTAYTEAIEKAAGYEDAPELRDTMLEYGYALLSRTDTGLLDRLDTLQDEQRKVLRRQTSFGRLLRAVWITAGAALVLLASALTVAQWTLWRRFRRRVNPCLAVATLVLAAVVWPAVSTARTQHRLDVTRARLESVVRQSPADGRTGPSRVDVLATRQRDILETSQKVGKDMDGAREGAQALLWIPLGGAVVPVLVVFGLWSRVIEYRRPPR